jgi:hypothetical protein
MLFILVWSVFIWVFIVSVDNFRVCKKKNIVTMDCMLAWKVILICMLLSYTLCNSIFHISWVSQVIEILYQNASSCFNLNPILQVPSMKRKKTNSHMFWIEPNHKTHWEKVEIIEWHTIPKMRDRKYLIHYRMYFDSFNHLVNELSPCYKSKCFNSMRLQSKIKKIVAIVIYRFSPRFDFKHMFERF